MKNIKKLSEQELKSGNLVSSWHNQYKDSAWVFIGGLPYDLTEGDVLCIFSELVNLVILSRSICSFIAIHLKAMLKHVRDQVLFVWDQSHSLVIHKMTTLGLHMDWH